MTKSEVIGIWIGVFLILAAWLLLDPVHVGSMAAALTIIAGAFVGLWCGHLKD